MTITTYAELQTAVKNWLERPDVADARVQEFIRLFEAYATRELRSYRMETRGTLSIADRYTNLPADFQSMLRVSLDALSKSLDLETADTLQDLQERRGFAVGEPTHYAILGEQIEVFPTPDQTYTANLYYRTKLPALSDSNATNWLLEDAPDAYLYGSLFHAASFLDFDERLTAFSAPMETALAAVNRLSSRAKFGSNLVAKARFYG